MVLGALGTSLTFGTDLPDSRTQAWPVVLQRLLSHRLDRTDIFLLNGAMRATSADFAALCFDELWGVAWRDSRGIARPPRLDLAIIEYTWSSSPSQVSALIEALHARAVPCVGVLYYHPVNVARLGRIKNDPTPWKGAENVGHQRTFARIFDHHGVPFINTSKLNARHGHRAMLNTTRGIWSAAHLSPLGHQGIAELLADLLLTNCTGAFRLPPPPQLRDVREYFCRIGSSLNDLRSAEDMPQSSTYCNSAALEAASATNGVAHVAPALNAACDSWQMVLPSDGRTPGLVTVVPNATLRLKLPSPAGGRFLSLGIEASYAHDGVVRVSCHGLCWCAPFEFDAHARKKYTYLQRTRPVWISPLLPTATARFDEEHPPPAPKACELIIKALRITSGRLMLKAVTMSSPRAGNRSVSTSSLYALQ